MPEGEHDRPTLAVDSEDARESDVNVSSKVIRSLSSGMYRTPASALKELVSNSFDARALNVTITTNYPKFEVFTCTDDGQGMTFEQFDRIMKQIGGSTKRAESQSVGKRPLIGRIGIGLLATGET